MHIFDNQEWCTISRTYILKALQHGRKSASNWSQKSQYEFLGFHHSDGFSGSYFNTHQQGPVGAPEIYDSTRHNGSMTKEENQNVNSVMNHLDKLQHYLQSHQLNMPDEEIVMMENTCWIKTRNERELRTEGNQIHGNAVPPRRKGAQLLAYLWPVLPSTIQAAVFGFSSTSNHNKSKG
ncbi:Leucine-rich repeats and immunoglobulin-like domains protein 1 [Manis javanica]|nr:Leucine-rich repeats and immunoglobulin-like domains protein 1 [Manis javanica]